MISKQSNSNRYAMNGVLRYSGGSNDLWGIVTTKLSQMSFIDLSETFRFSYNFYMLYKPTLITYMQTDDSYVSSIDYTEPGNITSTPSIDNKGIDITISNKLLYVVFFLKDEDMMKEYGILVYKLSNNTKKLFYDLKIVEEYPEWFI